MRINSGIYRGRTIRSVEGPGYRPATAKVRGAVFSMLEARGLVWQDVNVVDLFAGSGSLAFEALSRGAEFAAFVEKNKKAAACIQSNLKELGVPRSRAQVFDQDLFKVLQARPRFEYGVAFIDPPYWKGLLEPALELAMRTGWIGPQCFVVAEVEAGLKIDPEAVHNDLTLQVDKLYGQTRILMWTR